MSIKVLNVVQIERNIVVEFSDGTLSIFTAKELQSLRWHRALLHGPPASTRPN